MDAQRSTNTLNKTKSDINTWERFCASVGEVRNLSKILPVRLNELLGQFFFEIRKKDGADIEPDILTSLQSSIARKLKEQELVAQVCGNKPNACREVTLEEENKLFEIGQFECSFGCQEPLALHVYFGGFFHCTLGSGQGMKVESFAGVVFASKKI